MGKSTICIIFFRGFCMISWWKLLKMMKKSLHKWLRKKHKHWWVFVKLAPKTQCHFIKNTLSFFFSTLCFLVNNKKNFLNSEIFLKDLNAFDEKSRLKVLFKKQPGGVYLCCWIGTQNTVLFCQKQLFQYNFFNYTWYFLTRSVQCYFFRFF